MWDEDDPKPKLRRVNSFPLDPLGVAELQDYIGELQVEVARAEAAIARKQDHKGEASRFFRT